MSARTLPWMMTCAPVSDEGLSNTGFMSLCGATPAAMACKACARPISPPSIVTALFKAMFCGLNGATRTPSRLSRRHSAATTVLFPASEVVPCTISTGKGKRFIFVRAANARRRGLRRQPSRPPRCAAPGEPAGRIECEQIVAPRSQQSRIAVPQHQAVLVVRTHVAADDGFRVFLQHGFDVDHGRGRRQPGKDV